MSLPRQGYGRYLLGVMLVHALVLALLLGMSFLRGCSEPTLTNLPVELIVEIPPDLAGEEVAPEPEPEAVKPTPEPVPEPPPDEKDIPEPEKPKPPKEEPKPKPPAPKPPKPEPKKPKKIEVSKKLVRRQPTSQRRSKLTAEELQRLLDRGARTGSKATLSDDDLRRALNSDMRFGPGNPMSQELLYLEMVRQALYKSWNQPASLGVAGLVTQMEITVQPNGTILGSRVLAGSGNRVMDDSVVRAVQAVRRIYGVPASFFEGHRRIRVAFELTGD